MPLISVVLKEGNLLPFWKSNYLPTVYEPSSQRKEGKKQKEKNRFKLKWNFQCNVNVNASDRVLHCFMLPCDRQIVCYVIQILLIVSYERCWNSRVLSYSMKHCTYTLWLYQNHTNGNRWKLLQKVKIKNLNVHFTFYSLQYVIYHPNIIFKLSVKALMRKLKIKLFHLMIT